MRQDNATPHRRAQSDATTEKLVDGLGIFSIALGLAEFAAPRAFARALGMEDRERLIRSYGLREIASGLGILSSKDPAPYVWSRVAGDVLDVAALVGGRDGAPRQRDNVRLALTAVAGVTALDLYCARNLSRQETRPALVHDYSDRRGMPRPPNAMRGAARNVQIPADMRAPKALQPLTAG
jgi:hypothetical protein